MKLYFAGAEAFPDVLQKHKTNMLMSFYHIGSKYRKNPRIKETLGLSKEQILFIDSGAFSAFSLGREIKLDDYIDWCKKTDADYYAVYDSIGSAEKTLVNQNYMESKGIKPVPCFHFGEDWKFLDYYCSKYDYIAIGGMVPISRNKLDMWLQKLFKKYPDKKFHGFGLTTNWLVEKFPWWSVDSSSWLMGGKTQTLFDIKLGTCRCNELHRKNKWRKLLEVRGFTLEELQNDKNYRRRLEFNVYSYLEMQNNHEMVSYNEKDNLRAWF